MRQTKSWIVGIACGALCAVCVFMYLQDAGAQVDAARAEALERFGGEQVEVCVAKRDIAAGEVVDASSFEKRMWVTALLPDDPLTQDSDVLGKQVTSTVLKGEVLTSRRHLPSMSPASGPPSAFPRAMCKRSGARFAQVCSSTCTRRARRGRRSSPIAFWCLQRMRALRRNQGPIPFHG